MMIKNKQAVTPKNHVEFINLGSEVTVQFQANGFASIANKKVFYDHFYIGYKESLRQTHNKKDRSFLCYKS